MCEAELVIRVVLSFAFSFDYVSGTRMYIFYFSLLKYSLLAFGLFIRTGKPPHNAGAFKYS